MARRFKVGDVVMIGERVKPGMIGDRWPLGDVGEVVYVDGYGHLPDAVSNLVEIDGPIPDMFFAASELHYIGRID